MSRITRALVALALLALAAPAGAAAAPGFAHVGDFDQPVHAASPPDHGERLFVVEQRGVVRLVKNGVVSATDFLDISGQVRFGEPGEGERGLLSIAFAPDYETSGLFYVYLTAEDPVGELQVREYRRSPSNPDVADPARRIVWRQAHGEAPNHNGGTLDFGPDGFLWFATGDGGGGNDQFGHARDLNSHLGKMLRIDPRPSGGLGYTVPADNPNPASAVWGYGLRNPFRFSFDHRGTKDLLIGDVGQSAREEIDWVRFADLGGPEQADFGWSCREGSVAGPDACNPSATYVPPIFDYEQPAPRSVLGGVVVRDPGLPSLVGRYLYADTYAGEVRSFVPAAPRALDDASVGLPARSTLVAFGEDGCGHIYLVSTGSGSVDRIVDGSTGPCVRRPAPQPFPPPAARAHRPGAAGSHAAAGEHPDRAPWEGEPPRDAADRADRQRVLPRDGDRARRRGQAQARADPAAGGPPDDPAPAAEPPRRQADPPRAPPPPAADAGRGGDGEGRGRQHRPRAAPHEDQARLAPPRPRPRPRPPWPGRAGRRDRSDRRGSARACTPRGRPPARPRS